MAVERWLKDIKPGEETYAKSEIPDTSEGTGFTEAPRGSLLHYLNTKDKKIDYYQIMPATLWNCNPRDDTPLTRDWAVQCTCWALKPVENTLSTLTKP